MDEFIFVLLAGLIFIGVLIVVWGVPGEEGVNGNQTIISEPFSIGMFPKDVARQVSIGDFKVSYAVGSGVLEAKRDVSVSSKEKFSMSGAIDQDMSVVTGGFLNVYVRETNQQGNLIVKVNGKEVFNQRVTAGKIEIPLQKEDLTDYNIIEVSASGAGWKFWVTPYYKIDRVEFGASFYGNLAKTEEFQVYPDELNNFRSAEVSFKLKDYSGDGDMIISINSRRIFSGQPNLDFHQSFIQYDVGLTRGLSSISFSAESGASYDIGDAVVSIIREESATKSKSFGFTVGNSWNDNLDGTISFYISDTDYKGNLMVTITDTAGNKHPAEVFQSYSIGQTKKIDINKDYVDRGNNTVTFEATAGNFVLSNVEIKGK